VKPKCIVCKICGEDAFAVKLAQSEGWFARVRRITKCKFYRKGKGKTCQTDACPSEELAIRKWNRTFGGGPIYPAPPPKRIWVNLETGRWAPFTSSVEGGSWAIYDPYIAAPAPPADVEAMRRAIRECEKCDLCEDHLD
jgi:hypothetical protein